MEVPSGWTLPSQLRGHYRSISQVRTAKGEVPAREARLEPQARAARTALTGCWIAKTVAETEGEAYPDYRALKVCKVVKAVMAES